MLGTETQILHHERRIPSWAFHSKLKHALIALAKAHLKVQLLNLASRASS